VTEYQPRDGTNTNGNGGPERNKLECGGAGSNFKDRSRRAYAEIPGRIRWILDFRCLFTCLDNAMPCE